MAKVEYCDCCNKVLTAKNHIVYYAEAMLKRSLPVFWCKDKSLGLLIVKEHGTELDICDTCYYKECKTFIDSIDEAQLDDGFEDYVEIKNRMKGPEDDNKQKS